MPNETFEDKLRGAPAASWHTLDPAKARRMNAATLYIPAPLDVARAIAAIPKGQTRTIVELRQAMARAGNAETACPAKTLKYWKWMAAAYVDGANTLHKLNVPWWRVLKDGKPSRHMPGGAANQIALLKAEGVVVR